MHDDLAKQLTATTAHFYEDQGDPFAKTRSYTWNEEKVISPLITPGMTVVDVGAGNGRFARTLIDKQVTYIGIEPSARLRAAADVGQEMREGALPHLAIEDASADVTVCFAVLHHIPTDEQRQAAISELIRITKPGGSLIASSWYLPAEDGRCVPIIDADPGDVWVPWKMDGSLTQRYVHRMQPGEWTALWTRPDLRIQQIGLFGKTDWTTDEQEARNWFVIAHRI